MFRHVIGAIAAAIVGLGADGALAQSEMPCGLHRGFVADTRDPEGRDRLQVAIPSIGEARLWAERLYAKKPLRAPAAAVGDPLFIQFEGCDPARPIVVGFARP